MIQRLTSSSICRSVTYILWSSDFTLYLEDYLMEKCCTLDNGSVSHKDLPLKIYVSVTYISWSIEFAFTILIDINYLYTVRNGTGRGYSCPSRHLL